MRRGRYTMICTYCGANNADTANFCEKCGKQFETNEPTQLSAPSPSSENTPPSPPSEQQGPFYAAPSFPQPNATEYGAFSCTSLAYPGCITYNIFNAMTCHCKGQGASDKDLEKGRACDGRSSCTEG